MSIRLSYPMGIGVVGVAVQDHPDGRFRIGIGMLEAPAIVGQPVPDADEDMPDFYLEFPDRAEVERFLKQLVGMVKAVAKLSPKKASKGSAK